jgi:secreted trypsin-like serine protease
MIVTEFYSLPECGIENINRRIINGKEVIKNRYPWFVALNGCGASLISDRHIMTSAHCVPESTQRYNRAVLGVHHSSDRWKNRPLEVEKFILHEGYNDSIFYNDIAIIKLKEPVKFENGLNPVCLPDFDETDNMFAYGLGIQNQDGKQVDAKVMHEVDLDRITKEHCKVFWKNFPNVNLDYTICSLNHNRGTAICMGDSGSPVSTRKGGHVYQVGLPSLAPTHCNVGGQIYPNGYEKIFMHLDWIKKHTRDGVFCEAPHHPFAKSGSPSDYGSSGFQGNYTNNFQNNNQNNVEMTTEALEPPLVEVIQCKCGNIKGKTLFSTGKKPWDVDIATTRGVIGESSDVSITHGVLVSDTHILAPAKRIFNHKIKQITASDGRILSHKPLVLHIQGQEDLEAFVVLIELTEPLDITDLSPYSPICLPKGHLTDYFTRSGYMVFSTWDHSMAYTAPAGSIAPCQAANVTKTITADGTICTKKSYCKGFESCPQDYQYLMGKISDQHYLVGFPRYPKCGDFHEWSSVMSIKASIEQLTKSGRFCQSDWHMFANQVNSAGK